MFDKYTSEMEPTPRVCHISLSLSLSLSLSPPPSLKNLKELLINIILFFVLHSLHIFN